MRHQLKKSVWNVVSVFAAAVVVLFVVVLLAQIRQLSEDVKAQTLITQRYIRCLILLPEEAFASRETRLDAVDRCSRESFEPSETSAPVQAAESQPANQTTAVINPSETSERPTAPVQPPSQPITQPESEGGLQAILESLPVIGGLFK